MIRPYDDADLTEVLDVWYRASIIAHPFLTEEFLEAESRRTRDEWLPVAETTVYALDGRVVGFLARLDSEVGAIFVDPDHQRRGIGRALMDHAAESRPHLELDVFEANPVGRAFYEAYGFVRVAERLDQETGQVALRLRWEPTRAEERPG